MPHGYCLAASEMADWAGLKQSPYMLVAVGRTMTSLMSTPAGCSSANLIARAIASGISDFLRHSRRLSVQFEHAVAVTADSVEVLTLRQDETAMVGLTA